PQRGVKRRERLVQQEQRRIDRQRPPERDALPLTARELRRVARLETSEAEALDDLGAPAQALRARPATKAEGHVGGDGEVREERIALEDVPDAPGLRRQVHARGAVEEDAVIHDDAAGVGPEQPREALEGQRLASAGRPEEHGDTVARGPRDVEREARELLPERDAEAAHAARAPRRPARTSTAHESAVSASTRTSASPISPVCTAV